MADEMIFEMELDEHFIESNNEQNELINNKIKKITVVTKKKIPKKDEKYILIKRHYLEKLNIRIDMVNYIKRTTPVVIKNQ